MKKQKVCIVGGGLAGLVTAATLSKLDLDIDLIASDNFSSRPNTIRTTAISQNNYNFLKKLKIYNSSKKNFWACKNMKLYVKNKSKKFSKIFEIYKENKKILYMVNNSILKKLLIQKLKKEKCVKFFKNEKISDISDSGLLKTIKLKKKKEKKYNLLIICTGGFSDLEKKFFSNSSFDRLYNELSITAVFKHKHLENDSARQFFLDNEILALLPISNTKTSFVWTAKKNVNTEYAKKTSLIKRKIKFYVKNFYKNIKFTTKIESKELKFSIRKKYFRDRILLFGDSLHTVHPLTGQGFNMVLRDLLYLEKNLSNKINLGLDVGSLDTLQKFSDETKAKNFVYSLGIDSIKNFFSIKNRPLKEVRNKIILKSNNNNFIKNMLYNIADKGLNF
tara:strand:+ start:3149 stop:4321 length:1173 start_codon:yes stop_codon:yes gene_type:complete